MVGIQGIQLINYARNVITDNNKLADLSIIMGVLSYMVCRENNEVLCELLQEVEKKAT
jgi:hypothetical protein